MIEAISCGGVVIFRGKILLLYKNFKNKYEGWVLPKGTVEKGEDYKDTALREVKEESGATASIIKYIGKSEYTFNNYCNCYLRIIRRSKSRKPCMGIFFHTIIFCRPCFSGRLILCIF